MLLVRMRWLSPDPIRFSFVAPRTTIAAMRQWLGTRDNRWLLLLLLVGVVAYFSVKNNHGHRGGVAELDGYYYYVYLRSVQMDGDIELGNEYRDCGNPFKYGLTKNGHHRNVFGVGPALLWTPFFLVTHLLAWIGVKLGYALSLDGMSRFHQVGTFFGTLLYGWLAVVLCHRIARRVVGPDHALWAALGAALAGPLPLYSLTWASYSHAQAAMATSLMILAWVSWRDAWTPRRWILFGASAGLVLLVRPACSAFMLLPLFEGLRYIIQVHDTTRWRRALAVGGGSLAALVVFSPQMVAWHILFGSVWLVPQGEGFMRFADSAWYSTLFSPRNGLLTSAPLMLAALLGLLLEARRQPALLLPLCGVGLALLLVNGAVYDWWGWGFSARRFTSALPLFTIGLAVAIRDVRGIMARHPRRTIATVTALVVLGAVVFNLQWMRLFLARNLTWYSVRSTEGLYMTVTYTTLDDIYDKLGNPLSLPASAAFAIRHGGTPRVYDRLDGSYLLGEAHPGAIPSENPYKNSSLDMGDLRYRYNLSDAFDTPRTDGGVHYAPLRRPRGHVFLPLNRPGPLRMMIAGRALYPGTRVELRFNGQPIGTRDLPAGSWGRLIVPVAGSLVERGINRLDLVHHLPAGWDAPGPRCQAAPASSPVCSPVDLAVVSGGVKWGRFVEIWVAGDKVSDNQRGLNAVVLDRKTGKLLGQAAFDVVVHPIEFDELARFLRRFPRGSLVALGARDTVGRFATGRGRETLSLLGATTNLDMLDEEGYAAIGVLGAPAGSALEQVAATGHARVHLGRPPPPWRQVAQYRGLVLR